MRTVQPCFGSLMSVDDQKSPDPAPCCVTLPKSSSAEWYIYISLSLSHIPRKIPLVLPHDLVMKMPLISDSEIKEYWDHLSACNSPLAKVSETKTHYPLWIWGDEAQYRESGDEVLLISLGAVLDQRKYSVEACFPICVVRTEASLGQAYDVKFSLGWNLTWYGVRACGFSPNWTCRIADQKVFPKFNRTSYCFSLFAEALVRLGTEGGFLNSFCHLGGCDLQDSLSHQFWILKDVLGTVRSLFPKKIKTPRSLAPVVPLR